MAGWETVEKYGCNAISLSVRRKDFGVDLCFYQWQHPFKRGFSHAIFYFNKIQNVDSLLKLNIQLSAS